MGDPLPGGSLSYDWNYGDATTYETTSHASHSYAANNDYTARLIVTDRCGFPSSEKTLRVVVAGTPTVVLRYNTDGNGTYSATPATPGIIVSGGTVFVSGTTSTSNDPLVEQM